MAPMIERNPERPSSILPADEAVAMFDREARRVTGMSGPEFLAKWNAGRHEDVDLCSTREGRGLLDLVLLIPFGRRIS